MRSPSGQGYLLESEPNDTPALATPLTPLAVALGNVSPAGDVDCFSFTAAAGDRVYAATMTSFNSAGSSVESDTVLELLAVDGTTVLESDDDDGWSSSTSSSLAGTAVPSGGTYYLRVRHADPGAELRPYELHFRLQSGAPTPESEPNDTPAGADPLPPGGWVSGARNPALQTEQDWFRFDAQPGDTVFLSLDLDPERDGVQWNGRLGIALFGDAGNQILAVDDHSAGSAANPLSEALFMTVKTAGTYYAFVDAADAATGGPTATYTLSVSIHPASSEGVSCATYASSDVPKAIGPGAGLVSSTLEVPGHPRIADLDLTLQLDHAVTADIDAHLRSPQGNDNGVFADVGSQIPGGQVQMEVTFDDEAGIPPTFAIFKRLVLKPGPSYRLGWFDGEDAGGTWTLDLRDDGDDAHGGTLYGWSLRICEPAPPPDCPWGHSRVVVYGSDFEADGGGFSHSGTADDWARGLPASAPITTCDSGLACWKTHLEGPYSPDSDQDLTSPAIDLSTAGLASPVLASWSQRHQMGNATSDHAFVEARDADAGQAPQRLWDWRDAHMADAVGSPPVPVQESAGWGRRTADVSAFLGQDDFQLRFHLDSDGSGQFAGLAVDDVEVSACRPTLADLSITNTDGVATAVPGAGVTYTIVAGNGGPEDVAGAVVTDAFPGACVSVTWTCAGAGGASCAPGGNGDIHDTDVSLPSGGSVTYTAVCGVASSATGTLVNSATVTGAASDPDLGNNAAADSDTLVPVADLALTLQAAPDPVGVHQAVGYSLSVHNGGPSDAAQVTLTAPLPSGTVFLSATPPCALARGVVTCPLGTLAAGQDWAALLTVRTTVPGTLSGNAAVSSPTADPAGANNSADSATSVEFHKGDFDNDLHTDLYLAHTLSGEHQVWQMNGNARTAVTAVSPTPASLDLQAAGVDDFDGDFWNDLVFWNRATGAVEFWLMDGSGSRSGPPVPLTGAPVLATNWKLSATADFDHDGRPDIVWRNVSSQKIVIWTMNGTAKAGHIVPAPDQAVDLNWEIVGAFDMNGDGDTDFLWYNWSSGKIVYWWMDATVQRIAGNFTTPPNAGDANWKVLAAGDYGVDASGLAGTQDLVWRNATSGRFVMWFLDSSGVRTSGTFTVPWEPPTTPTAWTIVGPR